MKVDEYLTFGVPYIWIIDPILFRGEIHTPDGIERVRDGLFKAEIIEIKISNLPR